ncbi:MAG TPA: glycosyltransferase family 4 protein [Rhodospirillales bacterium]|nr:glycosyltransferase family 4 protein [Rhodospirillales bacterium]
MRIAVVSPLIESVPPTLYGGTERVVSYLTEELVALGHDVTLFASGDSTTRARLVPCCERALRLDPRVSDYTPHHLLLMQQVHEQADAFDILHFHIDYLHYPLFARRAWRTLTTLHGRQDLWDPRPLYRRFPQMPLVSISDAQREPLRDLPLCWAGTVHHGLPIDLYRPSTAHRGYALFLGRIAPEKRPDRAIRIARRAGVPLKIAAKVDRADRRYFEEVIVPLLKLPGIEFLGEVDDRGKQELLAGAAALLFPIDWPEPFGLVMIEAMACGTPVIAWRCGSVPEIVEPGVTGWIVGSEEEAARALGSADLLDRRRVRARFEARFTARRMALDYLAIYERLAGAARPQLSVA